MSKTCAILQPNYIPWKGYFDLMSAADEFVIYDTVQYTRNDWRNRNRLKTPQGQKWLTIPVGKKAHRQRINEVKTTDKRWKTQHASAWQMNYAEAPAAETMLPYLRDAYDSCPSSSLVDICMHFLDRIRMILEIDTPLVCSSELLEDGSVDSLNPTERLVYLCQRMHCDRYLSGPAARDYLEQKRFHEAGIEVEWFAYPEYPEYDQPHPPFEHAVSAFDLLLCKGAEARAFISR